MNLDVICMDIKNIDYFKDKVNITTATQTEIDSVRVKQALEGLKVYQDFLNEKRDKLQKEQEELAS